MSDFFSKILAVFPKEIRDNWVLIVLLIIGGMYLFNYFKMKGSMGSYGNDMMSSNDQGAYKKQGPNGAQPAEDIGGAGNGGTGRAIARAHDSKHRAAPWSRNDHCRAASDQAVKALPQAGESQLGRAGKDYCRPCHRVPA